MRELKRSRYVFFYFEDGAFIDISKLLEQTIAVKSIKQIYALSVLCGDVFPITKSQLEFLYEIPSDRWMKFDELVRQGTSGTTVEEAESLARKGLLLFNDNTGPFRRLLRKHEKLAQQQWNILAALYHYTTKWKDCNLNFDLPENVEELGETQSSEEVFAKFIEAYGKPPSHFYAIDNPESVIELSIVERHHPLYAILENRKTTRGYDATAKLKQADLSSLLHYAFGCKGYTPVYDDIIGLKKTSPSGGGLHPIEAYLLVLNVEGVDAGLYHYNVEHHSLETIETLGLDAARELANEFTAGQSYPRWAQVLFIMTARFYRNFWKYRKHPKAYSVLFMDAAHLSQTLYLICSEMAIGGFFTAAINAANIEERLRLDGFEQGALAIFGCGLPLKRKLAIDPEFVPYTSGVRHTEHFPPLGRIALPGKEKE